MLGALAAVTVSLAGCQPATPAGAALPVWSPQGNQLAFTVPRLQSAAIEVARPGAVRPIYGYGWASYDSAPVKLAWAAQSGRLASQKRTGAIDVVRFGRFGGGRELVHAEFGTQTELGDWSPDGRELVFARAGHLHVLDAQTEEIRYIGDGVHPTWSPDGREIAFARGDRLHAMRPDGTTVRTIATGVAPLSAITWSPDSTRLAFLVRNIAIVPRGGGEPVYYSQAVAPLAWRPNGIFFSVETVAPVRSGVWRLNPDTGRAVTVTHLPPRYDARFASASLDGRHIAYDLDVDNQRAGVRVIGADGYRDGPLLACHGSNRPDRVRGSRLNDVIRVNGGGLDSVTCARGNDVVYADRRDRVARDCEDVVRL